MKRAILLVFLLVLVAQPELLAQGCSQCKALAEQGNSSSNEESVGRNINNAIIFLMSVPYVLLFILFRKKIFAFIREFRGKEAKAQ